MIASERIHVQTGRGETHFHPFPTGSMKLGEQAPGLSSKRQTCLRVGTLPWSTTKTACLSLPTHPATDARVVPEAVCRTRSADTDSSSTSPFPSLLPVGEAFFWLVALRVVNCMMFGFVYVYEDRRLKRRRLTW